MKPIAPNTLIQNRYLIVHLIGKGGMGEVYLAVDQRLGSAIALKRTFFSDDATLGHAFEREARTLARLRHPVLPKVSDHFTEEGTQYLVMEHISGEDLSKRLETAEKLFPISWVLFWADQLLDALNYLHSHEPPIVHRDIKPQNLKLTDENHIVLLDFGLSKNSVGETRVTTAGSIVGYTPHYAPMEQIRGTGTDARSDLYSLAATLYQILTNNVPPDALTRADSLINGLPDPVEPISDLNPEVSRAVSDVILKGMAISQGQRYKTAREMQKALRDAYAQIQTDMSANTVAFNNGAGPAHVPQSPLKTAELSGLPLAAPMPPVSQVTPAAGHSGANGAKTNAAPPPPNPNVTEPNFDATMRYDSKVPEPSAHIPESLERQSDIKTEVFLAGSSAAISAVQKQNQPAPNNLSVTSANNANSILADELDFSAENDGGQAASYSPDATVPLFTFDKNENASKTSTDFDALPERTGDYKNSADFSDVSLEQNESGKQTQHAAAVPPKQKSGKSLAIGGGLFALLILAVGAAGIGWFATKNQGTTTEITQPSPVTEPTSSAQPSVEPTAQPTVEVVTEPESGNTNTLPTTAATPANSGGATKPIVNNPSQPTVPTAQPGRNDPPRPPVNPPKPAPEKKPTPVKKPTIIIES